MLKSRMIGVLCCFIFFASLVVASEHAEHKSQESIWAFSRISQNNVLHSVVDVGERAGLEAQFSELKIVMTEGSLKVLGVCDVQSVRKLKRPVEYWLSESTVKLYSVLFDEENIPLEREIYEITSLWPQQECPLPFDSMIENGSALVTVVGSGYLLIFTSAKTPP